MEAGLRDSWRSWPVINYGYVDCPELSEYLIIFRRTRSLYREAMRIETTCSADTKWQRVLVVAGFHPWGLHCTISKSLRPSFPLASPANVRGPYLIVREVQVKEPAGLQWGTECTAGKTCNRPLQFISCPRDLFPMTKWRIFKRIGLPGRTWELSSREYFVCVWQGYSLHTRSLVYNIWEDFSLSFFLLLPVTSLAMTVHCYTINRRLLVYFINFNF
jgi:hypothetical protein